MNWYTEIEPTVKISQGDILFDCPIFQVDPKSVAAEDPSKITNVETLIFTDDVIVLTQACELEQDNADMVVVAQLQTVKGLSWEFVSSVSAGRRPALSLIGKHEGLLRMNYKIVDFRTLYLVPTETVNNFAKHHGIRLRMNTPHRELLSQSFGNYFARIGLPNEDHIESKDLRNSL